MTQSSSQNPFNMPPFDPAAMQSAWQQMMGQFARATGQPAPASMPEMPAEAFKQMHKAWLDAMARWADEYMRSPQFLEQMKTSLEGALAMRRQVDEFIRKATEQSYGGSLGLYDAVGAVRDAESWLTRRLDEMDQRLRGIEAKLDGGAGAGGRRRGGKAAARASTSSRKPATSKKSKKKSTKRTSKKAR
ncbi:MAG: hypothetical protein IT430_18035 [Phycisphaerales bacterium]|nr:hypothetical protein [Phycisphaerales bacterium]